MSLLRKCDRCGRIADGGSGLEPLPLPNTWVTLLVCEPAPSRNTAELIGQRVEVCDMCMVDVQRVIDTPPPGSNKARKL